MTEPWLDAVKQELGIDPVVDQGALLDTARAVAHRVERKATPLTTYLIGVAVGQTSSTADLTDVCARVSQLAMRWGDASDADRRRS